jgi:hypothetical protein
MFLHLYFEIKRIPLSHHPKKPTNRPESPIDFVSFHIDILEYFFAAMHFSHTLHIFVIYLTTDTQRHRHNTQDSLLKKNHLD